MSPHHLDSSILGESRRWLLQRYWLVAGALLLLSTPLVVLYGGRKDVLGVSVFVALSATCWLLSRRWPATAARLHLLALFPYWTWYAQLQGGLPANIDTGVAEWAVLLIFPTVTLVTLDGRWGALPTGGLAGGLLWWRFEDGLDRIEGAFLLGMAMLLGAVFRRLALQLQQATERMAHLAYHDDLTGLPNRRALTQRGGASSDEPPAALLLIDLQRFKTINDALGHGVGDEVLRKVASRIRAVTPREHMVARIGDDAFAVLLGEVVGGVAEELGHRLVARVAEPMVLGRRVLHVEPCVGIASAPVDGEDLAELLSAADAALYRAKNKGLRVAAHRDGEVRDRQSRVSLEVDLPNAVDESQLFLLFQPVIDVVSGAIVGAEALVRWQHPDHGVVAPLQFIEMAEETGHIEAIDRWVVEHAVEEALRWEGHGFDGWVAVNVSARTLHRGAFVEHVVATLGRAKLDSSRLVVELTESAAMLDPVATSARVDELAEQGVHVAIDDFGMGFSSLKYVQQLAASHLKIDRSFTAGIGIKHRDEQAIDFVLQLAERFGLEVVAEGVERTDQLDWLRDRGCGMAQGYGIGKPMDSEELLGLTRRDSTELAPPASADRVRGDAGGDRRCDEG